MFVHVFCGILFALKPSRDYSLCSVCILLQPALYSQSVVCILHSVCILPLVRSLQSAVRSPQSSLYTDRVANHDVLSEAHFMPNFFYQRDFATYFDFELFSSRINKPKNKRIILKFACQSQIGHNELPRNYLPVGWNLW